MERAERNCVQDVMVKPEPAEVALGLRDYGDWHMAANPYRPVGPGVVPQLLPLSATHLYHPHAQQLGCPARPREALESHRASSPLPGVSASLQNSDLWRKFHQQGNEMIITKTGRRMFPSLRVRLSGLDAEAHYFVVLELRLAAPTRFKYSGGRWVAAGAADAQSSARVFVHPDSPATGAAWSAREVNFQRPNPQGAKLTNNVQDATGHNVVLTSMHKYLPFIHVVRASDKMALHCSPTASFAFPETEFVAVTAYQNEVITKMKIDNNPFAKGFRETGMSRCRRKQHKMLLGAAEILRENDGVASPSPPPNDTRRTSSSSSHDDSGVSVSSIGSAPPSPPASLPATPPPAPAGLSPGPLHRMSKQLLSIESILAKEFGPSSRQPTTTAQTTMPVAASPAPAALPRSAVDAWVENSYRHCYPHMMLPWAHAGFSYVHAAAMLSTPPFALPDAYREGGIVDLSTIRRNHEIM